MSTKITVLCENTSGGIFGVTGEHGFSALIEKDGQKILFDTGQGNTLQNNARALQCDLSSVKDLVLSHGHYDHTGGLSQALFPPRNVQIIAHPDIFQHKYAVFESFEGENRFYIGIPFSREFLEVSLKASFNLKRDFEEIFPGIFYSGEVPKTTDFEMPDTRLKAKKDGELVVDPLLDDISLLIETDKGPVVLLGCAHSGAVNILRHFSEKTGHKKFHAIIGGTHLGFFEPGEQLDKSIQAFEDFGFDLVAVSHCTGQTAAAICYNRFQERFAFANAGWSIEF